jgi:sugar phosphate isomerase/epimerase
MHLFSTTLRQGLLPLLAALALLSLPATAAAQGRASPSDGLQLGLQHWTFRSFTFQETLNKADALGIRLLQAYSGQALGGGLEGNFGPDMTADQVKTVQGWLKARDLSIVSFGVTGANDEAGWRRLADFARQLGIRTIVTEVPADQLPMVARVVRGTNLRIALHNHPTPSRYADPAVALAAIKDLGNQFGICADTGHWVRSGYDPVASLRLLEGRIFELHFKDVSEPAPSAHDMPWGTGIGRAGAQIAELRRQKFNGIAFIEYEHNTPALEADVAKSIAFFRTALRANPDDLVRGLVVAPGYTMDPVALWRDRRASSPGLWPSPQPLLKPDLSNATFAPGTWEWQGDVLVAKGGGDLWTNETYGNFALSLEFRVDAGANSGVFIRASDIENWLHNAIEVQILQGDAGNPRHVVGSLFDVQAPTRQLPIEPGQWHRFVIIALGSKIQVHLDGEKVVDADLSQWTKAGENPDGTPNKFEKAYRDMARDGRIGLQYHGNPVSFRNLLIEKL